MPTIYLIRHGETEWNRIGRMQGTLDSPLTERGCAQASQVGQILLHELGAKPIVNFISSPLGRALQTAEIISKVLDISFTTDTRLMEISLGDWNGYTYSEILKNWRESLFNTNDDNWYFHSPTGETYDDVKTRVSSWLVDVRHDTIAVAHGISGKVLRGAYARKSEDETLVQAEPQDAVYRLRDGQIELLT
jgi:broad specificity phosphatase PhoE